MNNSIEQTYLLLNEEEQTWHNKYEECLKQISIYESEGWPDPSMRKELFGKLRYYSNRAISRAENMFELEQEHPSLSSINID